MLNILSRNYKHIPSNNVESFKVASILPGISTFRTYYPRFGIKSIHPPMIGSYKNLKSKRIPVHFLLQNF